MRLSLVFAICTAFLFALHADVSLAQTNYSGYNSPKSERACYKCCRRQALGDPSFDVVPLVAFFDLKGFEQ